MDADRNPRLRSQTVPAWVLWVLRAQIGIVDGDHAEATAPGNRWGRSRTVDVEVEADPELYFTITSFWSKRAPPTSPR